MYLRSTKATTAVGKYGMPVFVGFLLLVNVSNIFGALMVDSKTGLSIFALSSYFLFAAVAFWLDRKRS
jgi:lipopolysaccharide export LptBFGC system permease protein LptF